MTILTATYTTQGGRAFDVEVISEFRGMAEVLAISEYPFLHGASHSIVKSESLTNRRVDVIYIEPTDAEPLPVELLEARADYAQRNDLYLTGMGG